MKLRYWFLLSFVFALGAVLLFFFLHSNPNREYSKHSYQDLRRKVSILEKILEKLEVQEDQRTPLRKQYQKLAGTQKVLQEIRQEIRLNFSGIFNAVLLKHIRDFPIDPYRLEGFALLRVGVVGKHFTLNNIVRHRNFRNLSFFGELQEFAVWDCLHGGIRR